MTKKFRGVMIMGILSSILAACDGERPDNLGVRDGRLAACLASPNCVSSRAADAEHRIPPIAGIYALPVIRSV